MKQTDVRDLGDRYDVLLIDAYGVLVDASSATPGAAAWIAELNYFRKPYFIVTNDASRLPESCAARFKKLGFDIPREQIVTSGLVLEKYFAEHELRGAGCLVLGTEDSLEYVRRAGGEVVPLLGGAHEDVRAIVIADENGFPTLDGLDAVLTLIDRKLERGEPLALVTPNPDLIYPSSGGGWGLAAGSFAKMLEVALGARGHRVHFERLGKPNRFIFEEALRRAHCPKDQAVMIGDQLETDIRGANGAGIASALVMSGVAKHPAGELPAEIRPTYLLTDLS